MKQLTETQLEQTIAILKIYANTSGIFVDENGEFINDGNKQVLLPYCGIPVTVNDIKAIRTILKSQLRELADRKTKSVREMMTEELNS